MGREQPVTKMKYGNTNNHPPMSVWLFILCKLPILSKFPRHHLKDAHSHPGF